MIHRDHQLATNLEVYAEGQIELTDRWTGVLGFAASQNRREVKRLFGPVTANTEYQRRYQNLAPKIGVRYDRENWQGFANVSGSYEPPSFSEAGTSSVANQKQTAVSSELGARGTYGPMRWDVAAYRASIDHELLSIQLPGMPVGATGTINADRTIHQGVELGLGWDLFGNDWAEQPLNRLVAEAAWTYGDFRFHNDRTYGNHHIAGVAPHLIRGELRWENSGGYYAGPTWEWVPVKSFIDHQNTYAADPYFLVGFRLGRRRDTGFSWFIDMRNLTDERYAATHGVLENAGGVDVAQLLPGDGRSVFAGAEWRW